MRSALKILSVTCLLFLAFACDKDDDPATDDIFVGTYKGAVSYTSDDGDEESHDDGKVTVLKVGKKNYNFHFSGDIPSLTGIKFEEDDDHVLFNLDLEEGVTYVRIDESTLKIFYIKDGQTWTADAER